MRWMTSLLVMMCWACGGGGGTTPPADTSATDSQVSDTAVADTAVADVAAPTKLYESGASFEFDVTIKEGITYLDELGYERSVNVAIYRPKDAPTPMPVVILSHGGSKGKISPEGVLSPWPQAFAGAGYLAIGIAHPKRDDVSYEELCDHLGVSDDITCALKINWERPHDVARVIDWLEKAVEEEYAGVADMEKIAHFGHSAGAGCALMLAGATRNYVCSQPFDLGQGSVVPCDPKDLVSKADPRVKAVIAMSPQGPANDGFMTESFASVKTPVLVGTGAGDGDPRIDEPLNRKEAYNLLGESPDGDKRFMIYLNDPGAQHTLFQGNLDACVKETDEASCSQMRESLVASGLAFLDHIFRGRAEAKTWLTTGGPSGLLGDTAEWSQK